jgi:hypothetical protein
MEQPPAPRIVTVLPATVQTLAVVEAKLTGKPELAEAPIAKGETPFTTLLSGPKVIV